MSATALTNIGSLVTNDETLGNGALGIIEDAALVFEGELISWVGPAAKVPATDQQIDLAGRAVLPGFVDSHAHLMFAGDRSAEFAARMAGGQYEAGGIRSTVAKTRGASDGELESNLLRLVDELHRSGITTFETKSGYGLTTVDEARALKIANRLTPETTFLGAHVVPAEFADDPAGYVDLVTHEMLTACAPHARWIDVFCDRGAFDGDQARAILRAGIAQGLMARVHANQLQAGPGVAIAVEMDAASADHCTYLSDADIKLLAGSNTVATLLPGAEFSTRSPYPAARRLLDAGATVAIATDCNPGSSYTTSMPFCIAIAVREMHLTPDEAVWSATMGGARALRRTDIGRLTVGARADILALNAPSHLHLAYRPGVDLTHQVWIGGRAHRVAS
ncbi:MAG: imidazolonepropionase [Candidatus Nanopelagicales bacterium]|nr:imidazolonepropionase [Candidatus Nanopelagicales bacterium]